MVSPIATISEPMRNEQVSVGLTSTLICDVRLSVLPRKDLVIRNISSSINDIITINLGNNSAVANTGIILRQYELIQFTSMNGTGMDIFQGQISAICATANGVLTILER